MLAVSGFLKRPNRERCANFEKFRGRERRKRHEVESWNLVAPTRSRTQSAQFRQKMVRGTAACPTGQKERCPLPQLGRETVT